MIRVLRAGSQTIAELVLEEQSLPDDVLWVDLVEPTGSEFDTIEHCLRVSLPTRDGMRDIEPSRRIYEAEGALGVTATLILFSETLEPRTTEVFFVLAGSRLVTLRYSNPRPFRNIDYHLQRARRDLSCGSMVLTWLLQLITGRIADLLETIGTDLDAIQRSLAMAADESRVHPDLTQLMGRISRNGDKGSKALESIYTLTRILITASESEVVPEAKRRDFRAQCNSMSQDVRALAHYAEFQENRVAFVLDAVLGLISIEQNNVGKIFSVVATVFLPPTLIGSIYGMNFDYMPSLNWKFGYPMALLIMMLSAVLPLWYFRRKRWL
ncbi:MAG: CorA family divalent cation transporter [Pseudomonadota bacterium]